MLQSVGMITLLLLFGPVSCQSKNPPSKTSSSLDDQAALPAPSGVKAVSKDRAIHLTWNEVKAASSYTVYWSKERGVSKKDTAMTRIRKASTTHHFIDNDVKYFYRVAAVGLSGESELSEEVSIRAGMASKKTPQDIHAHFGRLSDRGDIIVFSADGCEANPCVYIKRPGTPAKKLNASPLDLGQAKHTYPAISGDGNTLAYTSAEGLFVHRFFDDTWNQVHLAGQATPTFPSISTDGKTIAWVDAHSVKIARRDGSKWTSKTIDKGDRVSLSGAGSKLVYEQSGTVFLAEYKGVAWTTTEIDAGAWPVISDDGAHIAYWDTSAKTLMIHSLGGATTSTELPECCDAPPFVNGTGTLAGYNESYTKLQTGSWQSAKNFTANGTYPDLTPNGKHVIFTSNGNLYLQELETPDSAAQVDLVID